jgi:hypothetical protein
VTHGEDEAQGLVERLGLRTEGLGPVEEWQPVTRSIFQQRHANYWGLVSGLVQDEPGTYDELPEWMTEDASERLLDNG